MIRSKTIIILLSLLTTIVCDDYTICSGDYLLQDICSRLQGEEEGQICYYNGNSCLSVYLNCGDYKGTDSSICESIDLHDDRLGCKLNNENVCSQYTKQCSDGDGKGKEKCEAISAGDEKKRCYYYNSKCNSFFNDCGEAPKDECANNIPSDTKYKCYYDNDENQCKPQKRKCNEYLSKSDCWELYTSTEEKRCYYTGYSCLETYKNCSAYQGSSTYTCTSIKLYNDSNQVDYGHKCVLEDGICIMKQKECSDSDESRTSCISTYFEGIEGKKCVYNSSSSKCLEEYTRCEAYNGSDENYCKNIIPRYSDGERDKYRKCVLENSKCKTVYSKCSDYDDTFGSTFCQYLQTSNSSYKCVYKTSDQTCVELPKRCEDYKGTSQEECELIIVYNGSITDDYHKCVYENNQCIMKQKNCSDLTSYYCNNLILSETKKCYYYNSKCIEIDKQCENYKGNDSSLCESLKPYKSMYEIDDEYECSFVNDKNCVKKKKEQSEYCFYNGTDADICSMYTPSDPNTKVCTMYNNKCIEQYKYCSDYKGIFSLECTSIKPYDPETNKIDPYSKCVFSNNICAKQLKVCSDYSGYDANECSKYYSGDNDKECTIDGYYCTANYKKCEYYNGTYISSSTCNYIKLKDYTKKCEHVPASGGQPAKCVTKNKTCSDLNKQNYLRKYCPAIPLNNYLKQCQYSYSNNIYTCIEHNNTCTEIKFKNEDEATEEKCNALNTTSIFCTLKSDKTGCRRVYLSNLEEESLITEKIKEQEKIKQQERNGNNNNCQCSAESKKYLKVLGLLFSLLLL